MNSGVGHQGERIQMTLVAVLTVGACSMIAAAVAFLLFHRHQVGILGAIGVGLLGPALGALLARLISSGTGATSKALVTVMTGAGNITPAPSYSYQESLVARGRYDEAEQAYQDHLATDPNDLDARLALAALVRDHAGDAVRAERLFLEARALRPTPAQEYAIANALIDLYRRTGQSGREMAELARFADRYRGSDGGNRAREALRRIKDATGKEGDQGWRYFTSREVREARGWAAAGGVAVHENIWKSRGRRTCHLLARGEPELLAAARSVGCEVWWIQRSRTVHFDLVEVYLERALVRCGVRESLTAP
jgi:tetratricopeptide (TPR) repeat protein